MRNKQINIRLSEKELEQAKALKTQGITISDIFHLGLKAAQETKV